MASMGILPCLFFGIGFLMAWYVLPGKNYQQPFCASDGVWREHVLLHRVGAKCMQASPAAFGLKCLGRRLFSKKRNSFFF